MTPEDIRHIKGNIICGFVGLDELPIEHRDRDICIRALETRSLNAQYIPESLFDDVFTIECIKRTYGSIIPNIPHHKITKAVFEEIKLYLKDARTFITFRHIIPAEHNTTEFMKWVYKDSGVFAQCGKFAVGLCDWVNHDNVDEEIALLMYNATVYSLKYIPEQYLTYQMCKDASLELYTKYKRVDIVLDNTPKKYFNEIKTLMDLIS